MIEIKLLHIKLGNFSMKEISLKIDTGEYFVILGPTGCGKTVLIECLAGIRKPDSGEIWIDGQNVTDKFPEERHIGYLPQDFALFPTMTVKENIAFGLKAQKKDKREIQSVVEKLSALLGVSGLLSRHIQGLSGGERQRVALARALATEPKVVFLDEPLSALDENTREKLASELRNIHDTFKTTFVHISHNFEEVAQVADRVALMNSGSIEQIGTVNEILKYPVSRYAAEFTRTKNIFAGTSDLLENGQTAICLGNDILLKSYVQYTGNVLITIRPEAICVSEKPYTISENIFRGTILKTCNMGIFKRIDIDIGILISAYMPNHLSNEHFEKNGDIVHIHIPPDSVNVIKCSQG
jgi:ABC-type Fe3+/spermidine/putrescine transport system ATPase subunit